MQRNKTPAPQLSNAGGGTLLILNYLGLIPGFIPTLALTILAVALIVLPGIVLGLAAAIVLGPPYAVLRFVRRHRQGTIEAWPASERSSMRSRTSSRPGPGFTSSGVPMGQH